MSLQALSKSLIRVSLIGNVRKSTGFVGIINQRLSSNVASNKECTAGTMSDVKQEIMKTLGIQRSYSPLIQSREYLLKYTPKTSDELPPRSMQDSFTSAIIPLGSDAALKDKYVTFLGSVRLGRLMEDMDMFAVWVVHQHVKVPNLEPGIPLPYTFVTILVDKISFTDVAPKPDSDIRLSGHVSWVGKTSIEVVVWLEQKLHGHWEKLTRAVFLMASRSATNHQAAILNPLVPVTEEEKNIFAGGESRKKRRMQIQKESLFLQEPNDFEQALIHNIFVRSIDLNTKVFNLRVIPPNCIWMEDAIMSTMIMSHPEDRNAHNAVFGGFLMRHALELSWALAYKFSKSRPKLEHISDIAFLRPVHVNSIISMNAHVVYTHLNYMEIVVIADTIEPGDRDGHNKTTNTFYYTYSNPETVPEIIPKTYYEAMWFLDGRRKFNAAMGLDLHGDNESFQTLSPQSSSKCQ